LAEDDWRRRSPEFQEPNLSRNLRFVDSLRPIAEEYSKTVGQLTIAWVLMHPAVISAIVGARRPDQVEENVGRVDFTIDEVDMHKIDKLLNNIRENNP
jgi:aryl-alcohol dehydrogenase-like predicted oxidoreductase